MTASTGNRQRDFPLSALSMATDDGGFSCKLRHSETNLTGLLSEQQGVGRGVKPEKAMTKIGKNLSECLVYKIKYSAGIDLVEWRRLVFFCTTKRREAK